MLEICIKADISIKDAMKLLEKTAEKCLLVVDSNNKLLGTLTDGDLRIRILAGAKFSEKIAKSFNSKPTVLKKNQFSSKDAKNLLVERKIDLIPIIDDKGCVVDYVTLQSMNMSNDTSKSLIDIPVVIMAGGRGSRLEPFTSILPKPLVPIEEKPIIEHIIERFVKLGCNEFYLTINYKGKLLKAYFEELQPEYNVHFIEEDKPLGTAGSLKLLQGEFDKPFFVTNCDIIIKADYARLYRFHKEGSYQMSLVASTKEYIIPYGTCELNSEGYLSHINEKPKYDFLINTGLYVMDPKGLDLIPDNEFFHITHLIEESKNQGNKVGVFPIDDDSWIDVGQWTEYQKVVKQL